MKTQGFVLIELVVALGILILLAALAIPALRVFQQQQNADWEAQEILGTLRNAQNKTLASEDSSSYGVYFDTVTTPHQFTLFKGASYALRDSSADEIHILPAILELYGVNVAQNQVVFNEISGATSGPGDISTRLIADHSQTRTVYVESTGQIGTLSPPIPSDTARIKDSRHAHVEYAGRTIQTSTENINLTFPGEVTQTIPIGSNMQAGQIYWTGSILVNGENQVLTIATHVLNDANLHTQFSIHRDKRYNTQPVTIELSGDSTGTLMSYDATGQTAIGTSLYASTPVWQ